MWTWNKTGEFDYPGLFHYYTNKNDDAQYKIALAHQSIGSIEKARSEFQRLIEYFPGSEFYQQAKTALKSLPIN